MTEISSDESASSVVEIDETISSSHEEMERKTSSPLSENVERNSNPPNPLLSLTPDSVYDFYTKELFPAILSSFPILVHRFWKDIVSWTVLAGKEFYLFIQPKWMKETAEGKLLSGVSGNEHEHFGAIIEHLWEHAVQSSKNVNATIGDFMINHFDKDHDGHISSNELLNMTNLLARLPMMHHGAGQAREESFWAWFSREWPLMDWKIGVFLWQTFGGILFVIAVLSIMPGRLHSWSGKVLRWPILGLTYLLITVELIVYVAIRLVIRLIETLVATPKHRALRAKMANSSTTYQEWYQYAAELDKSQERNVWQSTTSDETSYQYNWPLIEQLMQDMREARLVKRDPILALAVLQQCTRKNVGGIMNEDLFSKTYTGEPKFIVLEFINEVTETLYWVTNETLLLEELSVPSTSIPEKQEELQGVSSTTYETKLQEKSRLERDHLWSSLLALAKFDFRNKDKKDQYNPSSEKSTNQKPESLEDMDATPPISPSGSHSTTSSNSSTSPPVQREQLLRFLKRARTAYGRTALCLSGGSMMGLYHLGHLKGLMETDCLPEIVSGCSAGSVIGAILCTRTNEELLRDLDPQVVGPRLRCFDRTWLEMFRSMWKTGNLFDGDDWLQMIKWFTLGDMTFEEAYHKTGRILCIALAATAKKTPPILVNYISAPNVTIASAVVASAAVPGFVSPQKLQVKDPDGTIRSAGPETYYDGSIRHDIPTDGLSEMLNCHFFVACQCNPHIVPFFFNPKGGVGRPTRWSGGEKEMSWRGGFLLAALEMYLKNDMRAKFVFLRDLDAAVSFTGTMMTQSFEGTTTIVPQVELRDFFTLFSDPSVDRLYHYLQVGSVTAYQHAAMIRCHYRIADALEECIEKLEAGQPNHTTRQHSFESPRKMRISRKASYEVGDMKFVNEKQNRRQQASKANPKGVPDIITPPPTATMTRNYRQWAGDSDSVSTSSETRLGIVTSHL